MKKTVKEKNKFEEVKMRDFDKQNMIMSLKDEADTMKQIKGVRMHIRKRKK